MADQIAQKEVFKKKGFIKRHANTILYTLTIIIGTATVWAIYYNLTHDVHWESWFVFWKYYMSILFLSFIPVTIWFIIGGLCDLFHLLKILKTEIVDEKDDGIVREQLKKNKPDLQD